MGRLGFTWKFSLVSALFMLPLIVLGLGLISDLNEKSKRIKDEIQGLKAVEVVFDLMQQAEKYRDYKVVNRDVESESVNKELKAITANIESSFVMVQKEIAYFSSEPLNNRYESLKRKWKSMRATQFQTRGVKAYYLYFDELIVGIRHFIGDIGNASGLVLDPKIETFLLIKILTQQLPKATYNMGLARAVGSYGLTQNYLTSDVYEVLDDAYMGLESDFDTIVASIAYSTENKDDLLEPIDNEVTQAVGSIHQLQIYLSENIIEAEDLTLKWSDFFSESTQHIDNVYKLVHASIPFAKGLLESRRSGLYETFIIISFSSFTLLMITFYLMAGMYFSITNTVKKFTVDALRATKGDLTVVMEPTTQDELSGVSVAFNNMIQNIKEVVILVKGTSSDVVSLSSILRDTAEKNQTAIKSQQKDISELRGEIKQITDSTEDIVSTAEGNASLTGDINNKSIDGINKLEEATNAISNLVESIDSSGKNISHLDEIGKEIETVIDSIKSIADQTNLLALNAAIEAARAGEAGRGFAVVADEVRTLATNTVSSTEEISDKVQRFTSSIKDVTTSMALNSSAAQDTSKRADEVTVALKEIHETANEIGGSANMVSEGALNQSDMINTANNHIRMIEHSVNDSSHAVEGVVKVTSELNSLTAQLSLLVGRFTVDDDQINIESSFDIYNIDKKEAGNNNIDLF